MGYNSLIRSLGADAAQTKFDRAIADYGRQNNNVLLLLMVLTIVAEQAPLKVTDDRVVRVGKTRVTLDTVVAVFKQGATAEEIVYRYPSLQWADVYATIAFYLNHQQEVEAYLQQLQQQAQEVRKMNEAKFDPQGLRDRLVRQTRNRVSAIESGATYKRE